jgi:sulfonate dioxygenase
MYFEVSLCLNPPLRIHPTKPITIQFARFDQEPLTTTTMSPQKQTTTATSHDTSAVAPTPIKNALALEVEHAPIENPELTRVFPDKTYPPIPELPYEDRALKADPTFKNLLANASIKHLAPKVGSEISGIQLHELTDAQKDELALLTAERGVVFFRDQEITMDQQVELGRYYGPLHIHQNFGHPEGFPDVHIVYNTVETSGPFLKRHLLDPVAEWHTDVSYERQVRICFVSCCYCSRETRW